MSVAVLVEARVPGDREEQRLAVELEFRTQSVRLSDLIRRAVEEQVRLLTIKQRLSAERVRERLGRQYGEEPRPDRVTAIDAEQEVDRALAACRAQRCIVVIDGEPRTDLDAEVNLQPETRVQFIRLVPLQGG